MPVASLPITVLMNAGSGSNDKSEAGASIKAVLKEAGRDAELVVARHPRDLPTLARRAVQKGPRILVAAGGDGTLNAVATVALEAQLPFAVIPLGTFNYFARDLGIPQDATAATLALVDSVIRQVAIGRVNGRIFLNNASIGLYSRLIELRETHKQRFGRNRIVALISGIMTLWRGYRLHPMSLKLDGKTHTVSSPTVFFGRNALQMEQLGLDEAECIKRGELAILAPKEMHRFGLFGLALRGAIAQLESADNLMQFCAITAQVDFTNSRKRSVRVAIDGELVNCKLPLTIESIPDALQVLVPRNPEKRA